TPGEIGDGPQKNSPVLLGEALVWNVYNAIFTSKTSKVWDKTLLIITFDEHGGCYDHVIPPGYYGNNAVGQAAIATPPDLSGYTKWDGFDFNRLGLRVPTIMVSPYIKKNTIINDSMSHTSFLKTMHAKWGGTSLSAREDASPCFNVSGLLSPTCRDKSEMPTFPQPVIPPDNTDYSKAVQSALLNAIIAVIKDLWCQAFPTLCPSREIETQGDAAAFLRDAVRTAKVKRGLPDADQINEGDWVHLFQAIAEELK